MPGCLSLILIQFYKCRSRIRINPFNKLNKFKFVELALCLNLDYNSLNETNRAIKLTYQECIWLGRITYVVNLVSKRNKVHRYLLPYVGRECHVVKEAKNGMLLVKFTNGELRAIPASCLFDEIMMTTAKKHK